MSDEVGALCQACAMCCDGTLFSRFSSAGSEGGGLPEVVPQPCASLEHTRCTVYERRPNVCRSYHCLLATALREKEVSLAGALELVNTTRARIHAVQEALGAKKCVTELARLPGANDSIDLLQLEVALRFHFRGQR